MSFKGGFRPPATGTTLYKPGGGCVPRRRELRSINQGGVPPPGDGNYVL